MQISFEALQEQHLPLLTAWLQEEHVREFWDDGERDLEAVRAHYFRPGRDVPGFIFKVEQVSVGFLQAHRIGPGHEFAPVAAPAGQTWGLDLLIGSPAHLGRGWGSQVIQAFILFWQGCHHDLTRLVMNPDERNQRALRAYEKAGFIRVGRLLGGLHNRVLLTLNL